MVIVLMLLHLSMMSPVQWKAKHNTRANFKRSFLIRKAFKGYLVSPCCGCSQIPFKITKKKRKHPHKNLQGGIANRDAQTAVLSVLGISSWNGNIAQISK